MGGAKTIKRQHERNKYTSRERIERLFDPGTFVEVGRHARSRGLHYGLHDVPGEELAADGIVAGYGLVNGRPLYFFCQDFTVWGGTLGRIHADKIMRVAGEAVQNNCPILYIADSGGARIQEGTDSLAGYGDLFYCNSIYSGSVPQLCAIIGPCAGGAVYSPALMDCIFMVEGLTEAFITGPIVIKAVLGEDVSKETLGGARVNCERSGNGTFYALDEDECLAQIKKLLSLIPGSAREKPPRVDMGDPANRLIPELCGILPSDPEATYDVKEILRKVVDKGDIFEWMELFGPSITCAFARMDGYSVGIIAHNPANLGGAVTRDASDKTARFIRFCDAYNIPIITFVDTPGFIASKAEELGGLIRHNAKIIHAYSEATVPKISVITRKAYGGPGLLGSKMLGADLVLTWPTSEMSPASPDVAVKAIEKDALAAAPGKLEELIKDYRSRILNPEVPAGDFYIDEIIDPAETRKVICLALKMFEKKIVDTLFKKHNIKPH
ncbi:MAG: acyl-CoA carboxylase subunit beta [Deltaproteobacteria bacterium]|nr:acyl-CoA carboxylase subunit beta [Deltaproteobacteria bacterium]